MMKRMAMLMGLAAVLAFGGGCSEDDVKSTPIVEGEHIVLAWNDLGMHCLNPTYDEAVILPPYNTVWAQVIRRGSPPEVVAAGLTVEYRILDNTSSSGKTDDQGAVFAQFWQYCAALFGVTLDVDTGLNLVDPDLHNGLSGTMVAHGTHFAVDGIPVVPVLDGGTWTPYQVAEITVKNAADGTVLARTRCTVPTSDEIDCAKCHAQNGSATGRIDGGLASPYHNILAVHDVMHGHEYETPLVDSKPVLCASCHASPALGTPAPTSPDMYLSYVIHDSHEDRDAGCYDCHPGAQTQCSRSLAHTAADGNCTNCHGTMSALADAIASGRVPWAQEPGCATCHDATQEVATGAVLYRNATGHGGVYCAGCHGSPHAMVPSREAADNYQALQYQNSSKSLGSCAVCHETSRGEGSSEFLEEHGSEEPSACNVCHTEISGGTTLWPHQFTWQSRS